MNNPDFILSQDNLNNIIIKYGFLPNVEVRLSHIGEKANSVDEGWTCFMLSHST